MIGPAVAWASRGWRALTCLPGQRLGRGCLDEPAQALPETGDPNAFTGNEEFKRTCRCRACWNGIGTDRNRASRIGSDQKYAEISQHMQKYAEICRKYARICKIYAENM